MQPQQPNAEQTTLKFSIALTVVLGLVGVGSGLATGSQAIIFDGMYSFVDVVPTMLYFLGLPIGRDMDGYARTDIFQPAFTEDHPITFIPTYER